MKRELIVDKKISKLEPEIEEVFFVDSSINKKAFKLTKLLEKQYQEFSLKI
ncbi:hypothetical protein M0P48_00705 [Candidatus Gracilibacteria bacterium]|jgi:hypothetical protein|nr:hypothetical protein [Candidatus Gracilibacteria bacterium]